MKKYKITGKLSVDYCDIDITEYRAYRREFLSCWKWKYLGSSSSYEQALAIINRDNVFITEEDVIVDYI